jgi:hypothetical protein
MFPYCWVQRMSWGESTSAVYVQTFTSTTGFRFRRRMLNPCSHLVSLIWLDRCNDFLCNYIQLSNPNNTRLCKCLRVMHPYEPPFRDELCHLGAVTTGVCSCALGSGICSQGTDPDLPSGIHMAHLCRCNYKKTTWSRQHSTSVCNLFTPSVSNRATYSLLGRIVLAGLQRPSASNNKNNSNNNTFPVQRPGVHLSRAFRL